MSSKRIVATSGEAPEINDERKKAQIPVRTSAALRQRLIESAAASDRSLTQEIEQRLEHSLRQEDDLGGAKEAESLHTISDIMRFVNSRVGPWTQEPDAWQIVVEAMLDMFAHTRPASASAWKPPILPDTPRIAKALAEYDAAMAEWEPEDRKRGVAVLSLMMKARTNGPLDDRDQAALKAAHKKREDMPSEPIPDLNERELDIWRGMQQWKRALQMSAQYAAAIIKARFGSEARK